MLNFGNMDTEIPLPNSTARGWEVCVECPKWKDKKKKIWQTNCGNAIVEIGEKNCNNCGNGIAENGGKKKWSEIWGKKKKSVTFTIFSQ